MSLDEMIAVLQAAKARKQVEYRNFVGEWVNVESETHQNNFNFGHLKYRVKPEPREWTVYACADGNIYSGSTTCRANPIKVREVL